MKAVLCPILDEFRSIKSVSDLVSWRNPKATGIVVGGVFFVLLFYTLMEYTMVTFGCRVFQVATGLGAAAGLTGMCSRDPQAVHEKVEKMVDRAAPLFVNGCEKLYRIVTFTDKETSIIALGISFVVAFLGNMMSDIVFTFIALAVVFASPVIYEKKKKEIDQVIEKVQSFLRKNVPMLKTQEEDATKKFE